MANKISNERKDPSFNKIIDFLREGPSSITKIASELNLNWKTTEINMKALENIGKIFSKKKDNKTVLYYLKDEESYFDLPIKKEDKKLLKSIYAKIKNYCNKKYNTDPTKTQVYKITWEFNKKKNLKLPIGWYQHGPCGVLVNTYEETEEINVPYTQTLKEITEEYCKLSNIELQNKIYDDEKNKLYQLKEQILRKENLQKEELNMLLLNFIKETPIEAQEIAIDFSRAALLKEITPEVKLCFRYLWKYIATIKYRESLREYYNDDIEVYLEKNINVAKKEAQLHVKDLVTEQIQENKS